MGRITKALGSGCFAVLLGVLTAAGGMTIYERLRAHPPEVTKQLVAPVSPVSQDGPTEKERRHFDAKQADAAWKAACRVKKASCMSIPQPSIAWAPLPSAFGQYHMGDAAIVMDSSIRGQAFAQIVMLHEMVHYLQHFKDGNEPAKTKDEACASEKEAVLLSYPLAKEWGLTMDGRVRSWDQMAPLYACGAEALTGVT